MFSCYAKVNARNAQNFPQHSNQANCSAIYTARYAIYSPKVPRIKICNANKGARNANKGARNANKGIRNAQKGTRNAQKGAQQVNKGTRNSI